MVAAGSFTKTVCPGVRVGYLIGPPTLIDEIAKVAVNTYISPGCPWTEWPDRTIASDTASSR